MTTAIIGVGQFGSALAGNPVRGGERVVLAAQHAPALANAIFALTGTRIRRLPMSQAIGIY